MTQDPQARPRVLVTGATGRIGRVVVSDLLARGYCVRGVTSREPPTDSPAELEWRRVDFMGEPDFATLVKGCDAILHLAAEIGKTARMQRVNVESTRGLVAAAERAGVRAFCYTSTVSVYGSGRQRVTPEDAPVLTVDRDVPSEYWAMDYVRAYGRTKLAGERVIHESAKGIPYVIFRPTVVVSVEQIVRLREWDKFKRLLATHRHAHHVFVRDVGDAIIWAMERALRGDQNPGAVETYNLAEDDYAAPRHEDFFRKAYAASGDERFKVIAFPGVFDLLHDMLRFRRLPTRNPLWRMRFPTDRLYAAGYRLRFGMAAAEAEALQWLAAEAGRPGR